MTKRILSALLALTMLLSCLLLASCNGNGDGKETTDIPPITDAPDTDPTVGPDTSDPTGGDTDGPVSDTDSTFDPETSAPETEDVLVATGFTDPLTGLPTTEALSKQRPVAVMINNAYKALPQPGISEFDMMYECLAEGGVTRLLFLTTDYADLPAVGSVRSSRDYFVDFVQNHDAIYVHAGGSQFAYVALKAWEIDNLDGVNSYFPPNVPTFYIDEERAKTMSSEHTMMTSGEGIVAGISYRKYDTVRDEDSVSSFSFVEFGENRPLTDGEAAGHIVIPYTATQFPQYIYNTETGRYDRFQFKGEKHIDGNNDTQLSFDNVLILVCAHKNLNDAEGHIEVTTTGEGNGYYAYGGKYVRVLWSKPEHDSPLVITDLYGNELPLNCGKTAVNIVSAAVKAKLVMDHQE